MFLCCTGTTVDAVGSSVWRVSRMDFSDVEDVDMIGWKSLPVTDFNPDAHRNNLLYDQDDYLTRRDNILCNQENFHGKRIGSISCLPVMNSPKQQPHKLPIWTGYANFEYPSLPIYRNLRYFTLDLRLKIEILHTPIMQIALHIDMQFLIVMPGLARTLLTC
jgi:hypothetical protein